MIKEGRLKIVGLPIPNALWYLALKEPLINLRIMAYCAFDSRATVWTGN
jgi:hypothetical protein